MGRTVACLDMGSSKVSLLAVSSSGSRFFTALATIPSKGIRKGAIIDMNRAALSIRNAVTMAEEKLRAQVINCRIDSVITGISGDAIQIIESYGATGTGGRQIKEGDIDNAISSAGSVYIPLDRELIHILPVEYILDGESGIRNPVGLKGFRLEVKVQILTAPVIQIENISACLERAGLRIGHLIFKPLAISRAVLSEQEMEEGVVLIDIGGGNSELIVFKNEKIFHYATIPVGGNHITNDIAIGLKIPVDEAEKVKIKYGSTLLKNPAIVNSNAGDVEIEIDISRAKRRIHLRNIEEIIFHRCEELASLIKEELSKISGYNRAVCGAVITGGTSLLTGLDTLFESYLGIPVRIGYPLKNVSVINDQMWQSIGRDPSLSGVIGLMSMVKNLLNTEDRGLVAIYRRFRSFFSQYLRSGMTAPFRSANQHFLAEGRQKRQRR